MLSLAVGAVAVIAAIGIGGALESAPNDPRAVSTPAEPDPSIVLSRAADQLAARDVFNDLAQLEQAVAALTDPPREPLMGADDWDRALEAYWDEHDEIGLGPDARGPAMLSITPERGPQPGVREVPGVASRGPEEVRLWQVRQTLADPEGHHDWVIEAVCDLDASDEVGEPVLLASAMRRL